MTVTLETENASAVHGISQTAGSTSNAAGVIVEFLGLPGVGKSSVSHRVAAILAGRGLPVMQPTFTLDHGPGKIQRTVRKSRYVAEEAILHPRYSLRSARAIRATGQSSRGLVFKMLFNWLLVSALIRRSRRIHAVHILDQGIYQALWSVGLGGAERCITRAWRDLAESMPTPTIVAVIEADLETVARRLQERGGTHSRADGWRAQDAELLRRSSQLLEETKGLVQAAAGAVTHVRMIGIDNSRDAGIDGQAFRLAQSIEQIYLEKAA